MSDESSCLNCDVSIASGSMFCDAVCEADYESIQANGVVVLCAGVGCGRSFKTVSGFRFCGRCKSITRSSSVLRTCAAIGCSALIQGSDEFHNYACARSALKPVG